MFRISSWTLAVCLTLVGLNVTYAQPYPNRPIRMLTTAAGGGSDVMTRLIAQGLTNALGQQIVVDNRPSGLILGGIAAKATPDGYNLLVQGSGLWLAPLLQEAPYDALKDFEPISMPALAPNVLVVHPALPVKSVQDLVALAKSKPGVLNYSSGSTGAIAHLAAELFMSKAGVKVMRINYKGAGPALNAVVAGEVQMMFPSAGSVAGHVASGRLRALAVTTAKPSELLPGLPTIASMGLPGYEASSPFGIFAPAGTSQEIIARLNKEIVKVLNTAQLKERILKMGMQPVGSSAAELKALVVAEVAKWGQVVKEAGIRK